MNTSQGSFQIAPDFERSKFIKLSLITTAMALALGLNACSAKVSSSGSGTGSGSGNNSLSDVSGTWKSACSSIGSAYMVQTITISQSTYQNVPTIYNDSACTQASGIQAQGSSGKFIVQGPDANLKGAVDVQITYPDSSGQTQTGYTLVLVDGNNLYFPTGMAASSSPSGRPISVDKTVVFNRVNSSAPNPTATPTPTPAPIQSVPGAIIGVWKGTCTGSPGNGYSQRVITITSVHFDDTTNGYTDAACTASNGFSSWQYSGPITYNGADATVTSASDIEVAVDYGDGPQSYYNLVLVNGNQLTIGAYWSTDPASRVTSVDATTVFSK